MHHLLEHFEQHRRLFANNIERSMTMKLIYSFLMLATFGLLVNNITAPKHFSFSKSEMREVNRRLQSIVNL